MLTHTWDKFVIYVNCYSAIDETLDSQVRSFEPPTEGLREFCRDANPYVWDTQTSFEEEVFEGFARAFDERFPKGTCTGEEGYGLCREWLASLEGDRYGTHLVWALEQTASERRFASACIDVSRQVNMRAAHIERTPQEEPAPVEPIATHVPSASDIDAVIALIAKGDEELARDLRRRIEEEGV